MRRILPYLSFAVPALLPALAPAITLVTPYDLGGDAPLYTSPNGDTAVRGTPSIIGVDDARTSDFLDALANFLPGSIPDASILSIGAALPGQVSVRTFNPGGLLDTTTSRYSIGSNFRLDYTEPGLPANTRWSVLYRFDLVGQAGGGFPFAEGFAQRPTYYSDGSEAGQRSGDAYTLDSNIYSLSAPGAYDWEIKAFLISTEQDTDGVFTRIVIHDGVSLPVSVREVAAPVPEPASLAALGLGAAALIRRRKATQRKATQRKAAK